MKTIIYFINKFGSSRSYQFSCTVEIDAVSAVRLPLSRNRTIYSQVLRYCK